MTEDKHMSIERRTFLKMFAGASVVALGAPLLSGCKAYPEAGNLKFFSTKEFAVAVSMAEAILPDPNAAEGIVRQLDAVAIANSDAAQDAMGQGLLLLEHGSTFLDLTFSRFTSLSLEERRSLIQKWFLEGFTEQRLLVFGIRQALFGLYYAQPDGYKNTGYDGPFVPAEKVLRP